MRSPLAGGDRHETDGPAAYTTSPPTIVSTDSRAPARSTGIVRESSRPPSGVDIRAAGADHPAVRVFV